ncbi:hypothetical protein N8I77_001092 [Diaporthe amygdali]|uniref:Stress response RCI peptide n=1 Tax=Phomopsis amygdali TaxID=1214568 RepID=A0AAD9SQ68_PHOAM|nr:stress response rci peptide [Diaporthe amygdali]KAJ0114713.1 stress response rci peptide [Diaporthe amygdali]KAK2614246.1 hypothetical protein N8I77_001092 [Diaporthe amygdali]
MCSSDIFLGLLAILFPPLPVWVKCGICSADSVINILLCVLGFLPGLLHAWYIIAKFPEPDYGNYERVGDSENGRVTYVVVQQDENGRRSQRPRGQGQPKPTRQGNMNYGTSPTNNAGSSSARPQQQQGYANGEGSSADQAPPPSYAQVVMGDNKIQDQSRQ